MADTKPLLTDLVALRKHVPPQYRWPERHLPNPDEVLPSDSSSIPILDLAHLDGPGRSMAVEALGHACTSHGFFIVKNHGVDIADMEAMLGIAREFFALPEEERMKFYTSDPLKSTRLSTSFNVRTEEVRSWRDFLRLRCHPLEDFVHEWPSNPPCFRRVVGDYSRKVRGLALKLLGAISESIGLDTDAMARALGEKHGHHMAMNYYPPCPDPLLAYGLPPHTDVGAITILLQDHVPGLQVLHNGNWVAVDPIPGTFVVNVGDQLQALSNGKYKSLLHRAVVNCEEDRISVPTFYSPSMEAVIEPPPALLGKETPALYRRFTYGEYFEKFWNRRLLSESCLEMFRVIDT